MCPRPGCCATMCYMGTVGIRQLRQNASAIIRRVLAGENIDVTDRGRPVARIVPLAERRPLEQLIIDGRATRGDGDLLDSKPARPMRGKPSLSDVLADLRADDR